MSTTIRRPSSDVLAEPAVLVVRRRTKKGRR